jgi:hypothetical protein
MFLKQHGFEHQRPLKGSHRGWFKNGINGGPDWRVELHPPHDGYLPKAMKRIIRQSGFDEAEWVKWAGS